MKFNRPVLPSLKRLASVHVPLGLSAFGRLTEKRGQCTRLAHISVDQRFYALVGSSRGSAVAMNDHQRIFPATKMPPRRKQLATSVMRVGRKSSFRRTSPKAQASRMWRTVPSAAEQIQSTFRLMTTAMPTSGLNPTRTTIDPIQETAHERHGSPDGPSGLTLNPGRPKCRPVTASVGSA